MDQKFIVDFEKSIEELTQQLQILNENAKTSGMDFSNEICAIELKIKETKEKLSADISEWKNVQIARHPMRPYSMDYISRIFSNFQELHGDRLYSDDQSMVCGIADIDDMPVVIISQQKGRSIKENIARNFGMQYPEGYRKALRLMKLAEKFCMPIITFVDTSGAFPGIESEERHVAEAIAMNLRDMMAIKSPIISVLIGEGGSGGAIGIAVADKVMILENAYYSVISPEGCAAIIWKDKSKAPCAAKMLKISTKKLLEFGIVDEVINEPSGGAHTDYDTVAHSVKDRILRNLNLLMKTKTDVLLKNRYNRYRKLGILEIKK